MISFLMVLQILGERWKVKFKNKVVCPDSGHEIAGLCMFKSKTIEVSTESKWYSEKDYVEEVSKIYYHELIHAAFHESEFFRQLEFYSMDVEHSIIGILEKVLAKNFPLRLELPKNNNNNTNHGRNNK